MLKIATLRCFVVRDIVAEYSGEVTSLEKVCYQLCLLQKPWLCRYAINAGAS